MTCIYLKSNAKTSVISYVRVPEYGMTNGSNLRVVFTPNSTPKCWRILGRGDHKT